MEDTVALGNVPRIVKEMTMAMVEDKVGTFAECFGIARRQLTRFGYLLPGSDTGASSEIKLSRTGHVRNRYHQRKGLSRVLAFDRAFHAEKLE